MSGAGNLPATLSLDAIAERIHAHLRRQEAEQRREAARKRAEDGGDHSLGCWHWSGASRSGAYVTVRYVSYQGDDNLTREQALHYLAGLDAGYKGRHYEYFREVPPPEKERPEARFTALVKGRYDFYLYAVTKRTATRVYGHRVSAGGYHSPTFLRRDQVLKLQATEDDLRRVEQAEKELHDARHAAQQEYERKLAAILGNGGDQ